MLLQNPDFLCEYCGRPFVRRFPTGRRPLYCTRTCRQRAYEQRTHERRRPRPDAPLPAMHPPVFGPPRYLASIGRAFDEIVHAMRPAAVPDSRGRRPTVCGAYVWPGVTRFVPGQGKTCKTCLAVTERFPLNRTPQPDQEHPYLVERLRRAADLSADLVREAKDDPSRADAALHRLANRLAEDRRVVEHESDLTQVGEARRR